jgi:hypothetical protein
VTFRKQKKKKVHQSEVESRHGGEPSISEFEPKTWLISSCALLSRLFSSMYFAPAAKPSQAVRTLNEVFS